MGWTERAGSEGRAQPECNGPQSHGSDPALGSEGVGSPHFSVPLLWPKSGCGRQVAGHCGIWEMLVARPRAVGSGLGGGSDSRWICWALKGSSHDHVGCLLWSDERCERKESGRPQGFQPDLFTEQVKHERHRLGRDGRSRKDALHLRALRHPDEAAPQAGQHDSGTQG